MISTRLSCLLSPPNRELATVITAIVDLSKVENSLGQMLFSGAKVNSEPYVQMGRAADLSSERRAERSRTCAIHQTATEFRNI